MILRLASGTGIAQPADVGLQRVIKHDLQQRALQFLVDSHTAQIDGGLTPEQVKFTTSLPILRDASVEPIVEAYKFLSGASGRELIWKVIFYACGLISIAHLLATGLAKMRRRWLGPLRGNPWQQEIEGCTSRIFQGKSGFSSRD